MPIPICEHWSVKGDMYVCVCVCVWCVVNRHGSLLFGLIKKLLGTKDTLLSRTDSNPVASHRQGAKCGGVQRTRSTSVEME